MAQEMASSHSLSFFADEQDAPILLGRLNADPEIAFIVPDGARMPSPLPHVEDRPAEGFIVQVATCDRDGFWQRWRTVRPVVGRNDGKYILWHISAGPLIRDDGPGREFQPIRDPWAGWASERPLCGPNILGAATIRLKLVTRHAAYSPDEQATIRPLISYWINRDLLVASDFQWTGASLQPDGSQQTARWAAGLKDWFSRNAVGLRARNSTEVFWAFPSALQRLKAGLRYDARGFDLDESIGPRPASVKIIIEYYPTIEQQLRARRAGARFKQIPGVDVAYRKSDGNVFEITMGDVLKYSKKRLGRFPVDEEIKALAEEVEALAASAPRQ
jgi:predicted Rdx family selenoprotein